mmetsp:Transcript_1602/g.5762  ORF Transcript_1602/g.5762 Transcript_1602/m.5762 type:complete len:142 (-) Transcript_1602:4227-4652(-)
MQSWGGTSKNSRWAIALEKHPEVPHIVNNAYGLQSRRCMNLIQAAATSGRVDLVVQSTDKNFLVPVGGSVLTASSPKLIDAVLKAYACPESSPIVSLIFPLAVCLGRKPSRANRSMIFTKHGEYEAGIRETQRLSHFRPFP